MLRFIYLPLHDFLVMTAQTPYEGGFFKIKLVFGHDFPSAPPKGFFITPIFHPNIAKNGEICVNTLKKDWKSDCKLSHILLVRMSSAINSSFSMALGV